MSDIPALDVAIGLIFLYFLLSVIASSINEAIASSLRWRAKMLERGVLNLLSGKADVTKAGEDLAKKLHATSLIQGLTKPRSKRAEARDGTVPWPAYIPAGTFVTALLSLGASEDDAPTAEARTDEEESARVLATIEKIDVPEVKEALIALYRRAGGDAGRFVALAEKWYDDSMARVSGWYRRKVQIALAMIAVVLTCVLNVDTIRIAQTLWSEQSVRKAVVASAAAAPAGQAAADCESTGSCVEDVAARVNQIEELGVPLGWRGPTSPEWGDWAWYPMKLVGLALTVFALLLGAPFWFDLLGKIARVRASGPQPAPAGRRPSV